MKKDHYFISTPFFAILGRSGGFIIPFLIAHFYGANPVTDAFFFIFGIVFFITGIFTRFFESLLIPYLIEHKANLPKVRRFVSSLLALSYSGGGCCFLAILVFLQPFLIHMSGIQEEYASLAHAFFLEMSPLLFLGIWIAMAESVFNSAKFFWFPAVSPLIRSLVVIFFIFFAYSILDLHALGWGYFAGEALRFAVTFFLLHRFFVWKAEASSGRSRGEIKTFLKPVAFQMIGIMAIDFLPLADQWFATWLQPGDLSLLNYGDRLMLIADQLFLIGFLQVFLSHWSEDYYHKPSELFLARIRRDIKRASLAAGAFALTAWLLRDFLIATAFGRSGLAPRQLQTLAELFGWLAAAFVPGVIHLLYGRVLFIIKKNGLFCFASCVELGLKIVLNYFFMKLYGVTGIAIAMAVTYGAMAVGLHLYFSVDPHKVLHSDSPQGALP